MNTMNTPLVTNLKATDILLEVKKYFCIFVSLSQTIFCHFTKKKTKKTSLVPQNATLQCIEASINFMRVLLFDLKVKNEKKKKTQLFDVASMELYLYFRSNVRSFVVSFQLDLKFCPPANWSYGKKNFYYSEYHFLCAMLVEPLASPNP